METAEKTLDPLTHAGNAVTMIAVKQLLWEKFKANEHLLNEFKNQFTFTQEDLDKMAWQKPTDHDYIKCLTTLAVLLPKHAEIEPKIKGTNKYKIVQKTVKALLHA